jgi:hypothetical protein
MTISRKTHNNLNEDILNVIFPSRSINEDRRHGPDWSTHDEEGRKGVRVVRRNPNVQKPKSEVTMHQIAKMALSHSDANKEHVEHFARSDDPDTVKVALSHSLSDHHDTRIAAKHDDLSVVKAAVQHSKADTKTLYHASMHHDAREDDELGNLILSHSYSDEDSIAPMGGHKNPNIALAALKHPKSGEETVWHAWQHSDNHEVLKAAQDHPNAGEWKYDIKKKIENPGGEKNPPYTYPEDR